jgi:hypothetical protein
MPSHFEDIGFEIENNEDFNLFIKWVVEKGRKRKVQNGNYYLLSVKGKIELWVLIKKGNFCEMTLFYNGKSNLPILIEDIYKNEKRITKIRCWVNPDKDSNHGEVPFVFEVPDYWLKDNLIRIKSRHYLRLTAFAEEIAIYKDEQDFSKNAPKNKEIRKNTRKLVKNRKMIGYNSRYFIPIGTFSKLKGEEEKATASFAGEIKELELITNKFTKNSFYWMSVETCFGKLDVVCAKKALSKKPRVGEIIDGIFYLAGKVNYSKKRSLVNKILNRI